MFPHIAVRTPILPSRDFDYRSRLAGYEINEQLLSLDDSIGITVSILAKPPKITLVLDPCWTLLGGMNPYDGTNSLAQFPQYGGR